jgi:hypothetical protein
MNRVYWIGVVCAGAAGLLVGFAAGAAAVEEKVRRRYEDAARTRMEAMRIAETMQANRQTFMDEALQPIQKTEGEPLQAGGEIQVFQGGGFTPADTNPYHRSLQANETPVEAFVEGGVNDYGISYIEEEEYYEDDGRNKEQITIVIQDFGPLFFMHGEQIEDWDERVGDSIVVDMLKHGVTNQLFVRNHKTDEDYEVIREEP